LSAKEHHLRMNDRELELSRRALTALYTILEDENPPLVQELRALALRLKDPRPGGVRREIREFRRKIK